MPKWAGRRECRRCRLRSESLGDEGVCPSEKGSKETREKGRWGERDAAGEGWGLEMRRQFLPLRVAQGDLFPGEPPPSTSQPLEQRVWEARSGSGNRGGGRREGRRWGQGRAPPHISSRGRMWKALSSKRLAEVASKSGRARVPYLTAALAPFLPQRPHPLRELRPGIWEASGVGLCGRNRGAAAPPAGAGRLRSRRAAPTLKVESASFPSRACVFGGPEAGSAGTT